MAGVAVRDLELAMVGLSRLILPGSRGVPLVNVAVAVEDRTAALRPGDADVRPTACLFDLMAGIGEPLFLITRLPDFVRVSIGLPFVRVLSTVK